MAALQARNRNAAQNGKTASAPCRSRDAGDGNDDTETLRRRVEELELENALMREVVEVVKDPGADLRRLSNREKTLLIDRLRPAYSLNSMICLLGIAPSSYHYHHTRLGVDKYSGFRTEVAEAFAASKGRYGYRRIKAMLRTGVSEKVIRRIMAETDSSRTCQKSALQFLQGRDHARAGKSHQPRFHRRSAEREAAHGHHRDQGPGREGVPLADDRLP